MIIDMGGGVFCILSLAFKATIDPLATVSFDEANWKKRNNAIESC
jgi:hypothetical protein